MPLGIGRDERIGQRDRVRGLKGRGLQNERFIEIPENDGTAAFQQRMSQVGFGGGLFLKRNIADFEE